MTEQGNGGGVCGGGGKGGEWQVEEEEGVKGRLVEVVTWREGVRSVKVER